MEKSLDIFERALDISRSGHGDPSLAIVWLKERAPDLGRQRDTGLGLQENRSRLLVNFSLLLSSCIVTIHFTPPCLSPWSQLSSSLARGLLCLLRFPNTMSVSLAIPSTCPCNCLCLDNLTSLELPCHDSVSDSGSLGEHSLFFPFVSHSSLLTTNQNWAENLHVLFVMRPDCTDLININTMPSPRLSKWWKHTRRSVIKCQRPLLFRICRGRSLKQSSISGTLEFCPPKYLIVRRTPNDGTDWLKLKVTNSRQLLLLLHRKYYFYLWSLGTDFFLPACHNYVLN